MGECCSLGACRGVETADFSHGLWPFGHRFWGNWGPKMRRPWRRAVRLPRCPLTCRMAVWWVGTGWLRMENAIKNDLTKIKRFSILSQPHGHPPNRLRRATLPPCRGLPICRVERSGRTQAGGDTAQTMSARPNGGAHRSPRRAMGMGSECLPDEGHSEGSPPTGRLPMPMPMAWGFGAVGWVGAIAP